MMENIGTGIPYVCAARCATALNHVVERLPCP